MKICPKCKNEYREGITYCPDCDCELINEEEEAVAKKQLLEAPYPVAKKALEYLEYCKFTTVSLEEPKEEGIAALFCDEKEYKEASKQVQIFVREEMQKAMDEKISAMSEEELMEAAEEEQSLIPPSNVYQNFEQKALENKSSAYSFLIVGALGCVIVALSWFGKLPFYIGGRGNWFSHGIMFAFFVIFMFVGIVSAKSVKKYKELASKEADAQSELKAYMEEAFTFEKLAEITADTEEEAYFKRMTYMRERIAEAFPAETENAVFVEALLDEHYDKLFG